MKAFTQLVSDPGLMMEAACSLTLAQMSVYIDDENIIYDAALNQTNIGNNNNKVRISVYF